MGNGRLLRGKVYCMVPTDSSIRTALGLHEVMRRMGIPSELIFINVERDKSLIVVLGPVGFPVGDPVKARSRKGVGRLWDQAIEWWNVSGTEEETQALMDEFFSSVDMGKTIAGVQQAWALLNLPEN